MKLSRKWVLMAALVLSVAMATTGTLAYLTDSDGDVNVMTTGRVDIIQNEYERVVDEATGAYTDEMTKFTQRQQVLPGVYYQDGAYSDKSEYHVDGWGFTMHDRVKNYVDKIVNVSNIGNTDAYVRMLIAIPTGGYTNTNDSQGENWLHWQVAADGYTVTNPKESGWHWGVETDASGVFSNVYEKVIIDNEEYNVYVVTNVNVLEDGKSTSPVIKGFFLDSRVDYNHETGNYFLTAKNANGEDETFQLTVGADDIKILTLTQAVQADGFETAWEAFAQAYPNTDADNIKAWFENTVISKNAIKVATKSDAQDAMMSAAENGQDVVIDFEGATLTDMNYFLSRSNVPAGSTVTIKNAKIASACRWNYADGTVIFENCEFNNPTGAYSIHFDAGKGDIIFKNCTLMGWCAFGSELNSVKLYDCKIGGNGIYGMLRIYPEAELVNCAIDMSNSNDTDDYPDVISSVGGNVLTLTNCTYTELSVELAEGAKLIENGVERFTFDGGEDVSEIFEL